MGIYAIALQKYPPSTNLLFVGTAFQENDLTTNSKLPGILKAVKEVINDSKDGKAVYIQL